MKILIDTNVALDYMAARQPHYHNARRLLLIPPDVCAKYISVKQLADLFYLAKKAGKPRADAMSDLVKLSRIARVISMTGEDFMGAVASEMIDFEDALLAFCAKRHGLDYIVTRNAKDFSHSPVEALSPADFLGGME